jgi:pristinamycin I synthase-3/4
MTGPKTGGRSTRLALRSVVQRPAEIPLSFGQRRVWFLNRLDGSSAIYTHQLALHLTGRIDRAMLEAALSDVIERHESLRTIFPENGGTPRQQILDAATARPRLSAVPTTQASIAEILTATSRQGFDLSTEIPIRPHLFVLGPTEHVLLLVIHHIASDGWSFRPLAHDLARAYNMRIMRCGKTIGLAA